MSAMSEEAGEGGSEGPSEAVKDASEAIKLIALHLHERAIGHEGLLAPEARFQIEMRDPDARLEILEQLLLEVCPDGVDAGLWLSWLRGGKSPFPGKPLKKVGLASEWPSQTVTRTTPRVSRQAKKVEKIRAELEAEERQLQYLKAHDNAAVHWLVIDQLVNLMAPLFAMGPAWTLMRAISGHLSEEYADFQTRMLDGNSKLTAILELREKRQRGSDEIMEALDFWSGNEAFERSVRAAIVKVIKEYEPKHDDWAQGRRRRSKNEMRMTAHPEAQDDRHDVLEGLKRRS